MQTVRRGFHGDGTRCICDDPVKLCERKILFKRCADEIDTGEGFFCFRKRSTCTENPRDQLELRDIVFLRFRIEINGISYKIKAGDTKPLFIERLIIERVIIHHTRHADHCIVMGKGRHMKKGKRIIARCNGDLVAIGKFIIECATHIKVACLIGCCCTHRKTPFDGRVVIAVRYHSTEAEERTGEKYEKSIKKDPSEWRQNPAFAQCH